MSRIALLFAVCFAFLFTAHLHADEDPVVPDFLDIFRRPQRLDDGKVSGIVVIKQSNGGFCSAVFSPDGKTIATAAKDNRAQIWDAETGEKLKEFLHPDWVRTAVFSPDGKMLVTKCDDRIARIWDVESGKELLTSKGFVPQFSHDGKKYVTTSEETIHVWDTASGKELRQWAKPAGSIRDVALSENGNIIVTVHVTERADPTRAGVTFEDTITRIWDGESGKEMHALENYVGYPSAVALSPDGKKLITRRGENVVRIWDTESGNVLHTLEGHTSYVHFAAFSSDGKKCVTTSPDATARIWDVESGKELQTLGNPEDKRVVEPFFISEIGSDDLAKILFERAVFSPDGKTVLTMDSRDLIARVWDVQSGKELHTLVGHDRELILRAHFSPDGKKVVTSAGGLTVRIWNLERLPPPVILPPIRDF